jgi:predicted O-methyltransferase YrrM
MHQEDQWGKVDQYFAEHLHSQDSVLDAALADSQAAGLPPHNVAPSQGKLLNFIARMTRATSILEIGTLGGYSTIWLARALPTTGERKVITLEANTKHAEVARTNIDRAGLSDVVEIRLGPAADSLAVLHREGLGPFDLIFIDADKPNNPVYLEWALKLCKKGSVIICDNVVRQGKIIDETAAQDDPNIRGVRQFCEMVAAEPRLDATALQTVGSKGWDGFAIALVVSD